MEIAGPSSSLEAFWQTIAKEILLEFTTANTVDLTLRQLLPLFLSLAPPCNRDLLKSLVSINMNTVCFTRSISILIDIEGAH